MSHNPLLLVVIDGFGFSKSKTGNAIATASKPTLDFFEQNYPYTLLQASGNVVGLDWGEPGNSEVGHLAIGAGRIFKHYIPTINEAIADKSFFSNQMLLQAVAHAKQNNSKLHLLGLLTSGSVHAYLGHLTALIGLAEKSSLEKVYLHIFTDGKDSGSKESVNLFKKLRSNISKPEQIKVATVVGRDFAMDRNNNWDKTQKAYELFTEGLGNKTKDYLETLKQYHQDGITDEKIPPTVSADLNAPLISDNDSLIFFNFREDSMKQIARSFVETDFTFFPRKTIANLYVTAMTPYLDDPQLHPIFQPIHIKNNLAEWLSIQGKTQLHIAESEKHAHVTIFFNGLENKVYDGETDIFLESPRDLAQNPEMRSQDIAEKVVEELKKDHYDFFIINFANADMLSHLGNIHLVAKGIEKVDQALNTIYQEIKKQNGTLVITSDHGNAESLVYSLTGERETKHNINPVPFYLVSEKFQGKNFQGQPLDKEEVAGILPDIAPTILNIMKLPAPPEMTGESLLKKLK